MTKPLVMGSFVANGVLTALAIGFLIWVIVLSKKSGDHDHEHHQCNSSLPTNDTKGNNNSETPSTPFSLKAVLQLTKLEYNQSRCLMPMKSFGFINTEISFNSSPTFEVKKPDECIIQKDFLDTDMYDLNVTIKKTDTNETMKVMVTFNVAAAEKSVFETNELVFVNTTKESADLEVDELYTTYNSDNSKVQTKLKNLNGTTKTISLNRSDLNDTNELVVIANTGDFFKKALIKVCYLKSTDLPNFEIKELKYNKTDTTNKMSVKAVTNSSCTIDTTYSASDSRPYEVKTNGDITLLEKETATNKTFFVTAKTVVGVSTANVTIIVV